MINFTNLSKSFSAHQVFSGISGVIATGDRIAIIGRNGAGKSTLLDVLRGASPPDSGSVQLGGEIIGYAAQDIQADCLVSKLVAELEEWRVLYALSQVQLQPTVIEQSVRELSGGQRTRLALALTLAQDPAPTTLLLDEPTNNLDNEGLVWLESFIQHYRGSVVMVSHDRSFINAVATKVWQLDKAELREFKGNYDAYSAQIAQEQALRAKEYEKYQEDRKRIQRLIREANDRSQRGVRDSRQRDNDKFLKNFKNEYVQNSLGGRAKALQTKLEKLEQTEKPQVEKRYTTHLLGAVHTSKIVLGVQEVTKSFGGKGLLQPLSFELRGGDRLWVRGENGTGKSTLLKLVAGQFAPTSGNIAYGANIRVGYFSQDVYGLEPTKTIFAATQAAGIFDETLVYQQAKALDLSPEMLHKPTGELSRGQQAKASFLLLLLGQFNLLVLDEPTNHLDIPTRETIEAALNEYKGALVVASHDRYFVDRLRPNKTVTLTRPTN
ncbi:MAG TPA: ABC-F family ATP-binding cassette domain-containing protein [Verrucomicrobiae bacterium]|nr:ABC-F family ATP-binding cassette domain-containing protein [Verrucomicrobiae bacterium]